MQKRTPKATFVGEGSEETDGCFLPPLFFQNPAAPWHTFEAGGIPLRGACGSLEWGGREVDGIKVARDLRNGNGRQSPSRT